MTELVMMRSLKWHRPSRAVEVVIEPHEDVIDGSATRDTPTVDKCHQCRQQCDNVVGLEVSQ